jgi:hypothetical protein
MAIYRARKATVDTPARAPRAKRTSGLAHRAGLGGTRQSPNPRGTLDVARTNVPISGRFGRFHDLAVVLEKHAWGLLAQVELGAFRAVGFHQEVGGEGMAEGDSHKAPRSAEGS